METMFDYMPGPIVVSIFPWQIPRDCEKSWPWTNIPSWSM